MTTLLDAGPLVAYLYRGDQHHEWAKQQASQLSPPFLTCEAVLSEANFLLSGLPSGTERLLELLDRDAVRVSFSLSYTHHAGRVHDLMRSYSDLPMSFADACLVRMAELYDDGRVFTLDSDFRIYQKYGRTPIPVLMPNERRSP